MAGEHTVYALSVEPDGTSWTARENLADILRRELLGPSGGPDETLEAPPDTRYLVGRIAPVRLSQVDAVPQPAASDLPAGDEESTLDLGDDLDSRESRGVPVGDLDDTSADADEDAAEDQGVRRGLMIPASMGLRFQVPLELASVVVTATWGTYNPEATGEVTEKGRAKRRFVRTPVSIPVPVTLVDLVPGTTKEYPLTDDVVLRVDAHLDEVMGRRLVEVALCNDRVTPARIPVNAWLFQTHLQVDADAAAVFLPVRDAIEDTRVETDDELRRLGLQYRNRLEFAIGRTCSADWVVESGSRRASRVSTTWLPVAETPQTSAIDPDGVVLDMVTLADASPAQVEAGLRPIVDGYAGWLATQQAAASALPEHLRGEAADAIDEARLVHTQLVEGLAYLVSHEEAMRCFAFMNRVMADQRIHTQVAAERALAPALSIEAARAVVLARGPRAHSWFTFQIAFIVMQIPAMCEPALSRRSGDLAMVELLFFPTGGGKTEAYLGLAAFTFGIRRRQGLMTTPDGPLDGRSGVAVLMRYTLRLLTAQQFQRATALVCAAELARRDDPASWGEEPFRIGLWVGTDVSPKRVDEAAKELERVNAGQGHRLTVLQVQRCPWCGTRIDAKSVRVDPDLRRVFVHCGDKLAACPFAKGGAVTDGLPIPVSYT